MNPAEWLIRAALRSPKAPALMRGTELVATYAAFASRAASIGGWLAQRGIGPGDRVAIFMTNRTEYLEAFYAIWFAGAAAVPINGKLHVREAEWILENSGASLAFVSDDVAADLHFEPKIDASEMAQLYDHAPLEAPVPMGPEALTWLFYTSGTTGRPKGVMMGARTIEAMALSYFADVDEVHAEDAVLYAAPMSHAAGIYNFMHVIKGARHVVPVSGGFQPAEIFALARELDSVHMFAAPTMVRRLIDHAVASGETGEGLRSIVYAGGPMYLNDIEEAVSTLGPRFLQVYGQGECPMAITALSRADIADRDHPRWCERLASVGTAQSVVRVKIVDEAGTELPYGEVGEIVVEGSTVMLGYWENPKATAKTIKNGWLWTGDMGHMDADGYVTLVDRSKDLIISGGSNVYPREVEEALLTHPSVKEVAVVGRKDPEWGEAVVAFVAIEGALDPAELDAHCRANIARFKAPKEYHVVDALPKNNYGKVLKTELRARLD
ncbi:MAG: AMP-binding protein [Rhodobacteraceae bacterium]|nr:AMP-binding protein [Paracoccaceae bacterium]